MKQPSGWELVAYRVGDLAIVEDLVYRMARDTTVQPLRFVIDKCVADGILPKELSVYVARRVRERLDELAQWVKPSAADLTVGATPLNRNVYRWRFMEGLDLPKAGYFTEYKAG